MLVEGWAGLGCCWGWGWGNTRYSPEASFSAFVLPQVQGLPLCFWSELPTRYHTPGPPDPLRPGEGDQVAGSPLPAWRGPRRLVGPALAVSWEHLDGALPSTSHQMRWGGQSGVSTEIHRGLSGFLTHPDCPKE